MVYLFLGQDALAKDIQLNKIREDALHKKTEQFNLDILYSADLELKGVQERFLSLPLEGAKRLIVIKEAQGLKEEIKSFLQEYVRHPRKEIILVLDASRPEPKDRFFDIIARYAKVLRFREELKADTFTLSRQIALRRADFALRILNQLLKDGERPERILGGLRYAWEKDSVGRLEARRKLKSLVKCDIEIKTGRLKPAFALEKLVVELCGLSKSAH